MNKNKKLLDSFTKYCLDNPEQRFWLALRNWNQIDNPKENFILAGEICDMDKAEDIWKNLNDTFYRE